MKTSTINRATCATSALLEHYCRGLDKWPHSWMGMENDLPAGERLVTCFRPFLEQLVHSDLSPKTIQKHVDNLWALGGEIIRDLNQDPSLRRKDIAKILDDRIDEEVGRSSTPWNRKSLYNARSIPRAGSFTSSAASRAVDLPLTHKFPGRGKSFSSTPCFSIVVRVH